MNRRKTLSIITTKTTVAILVAIAVTGLMWARAQQANSGESQDGRQFVSDAQPDAQARMNEAFGKMPLYFIENRGQLDRRVEYYLQGHDKSLYFTWPGIDLVYFNPTGTAARATDRRPRDTRPLPNNPDDQR